MSEELLNTLRRLEERLQTNELRQDARRAGLLLHPEFEEIGRSGNRYDRPAILAEFRSGHPLPRVRSWNYSLSLLTEGIALLTYDSAHIDERGHDTRRTLRSSLWVRVGDAWQVRFHQGTPVD